MSEKQNRVATGAVFSLSDERLGRQFWDRTQITDSGCWLWTGDLNGSGYGRIRHGRTSETPRRTKMAHRVAYEALVGPIPEGLILDHLCSTRACVNPAHLEPVTNGENVARGALCQPLADALAQAWDRLDAIFSSVKDPERVATEAWFGMAEIDRVLGRDTERKS